jgi:hypothetical protein
MYPRGELIELAERKRLLQARIAVRRWECAAAVVELSRPIAHVDRGIALWQRISPFMKLLALPAGLIFARILGRGRGARRGARKKGKIAALLAALPMIFRAVKFLLQIRASHSAQKQTRPPVPPAAPVTAG